MRNELWSALQTHLQGDDRATSPVRPETEITQGDPPFSSCALSSYAPEPTRAICIELVLSDSRAAFPVGAGGVRDLRSGRSGPRNRGKGRRRRRHGLPPLSQRSDLIAAVFCREVDACADARRAFRRREILAEVRKLNARLRTVAQRTDIVTPYHLLTPQGAAPQAARLEGCSRAHERRLVLDHPSTRDASHRGLRHEDWRSG